MAKPWVAAAAVLLIWQAAPGHSAETPVPLDGPAAQQVIAAMDAEPRIARTWAMCPADAYDRSAPFYARWVKPDSEEPDICGAAPDACYRRCMDGGEAGACFGLGRAFQLRPAEIGNRHAHMLFAMACANGMGAGCTNRASSLRNLPVAREPLLSLPDKIRDNCEHRSFHIGCVQGDAWSCSMEGQAYQLGEGVPADAAQARTLFERSCGIAPDFVACTFAKDRMKEMSGRR